MTPPHWLDLAGFPLKPPQGALPAAAGGNGDGLSQHNSGRDRGRWAGVSAYAQLCKYTCARVHLHFLYKRVLALTLTCDCQWTPTPLGAPVCVYSWYVHELRVEAVK